MRSRSADAIECDRTARLAALTSDERIELMARLAETGLASYMETHGVDRRTAVSRIKATRRLGRRHSACADADAD